MEELTEQLKTLVRSYGAVYVGIATRETLEGGPPSTDLGYILPEARSAISFALALNREFIRRNREFPILGR